MSEFITYTLVITRTLSHFVSQISGIQIDVELLIVIPETKEVVEVSA